MTSSLILWRDRRGRLSSLRLATLVVLVVPLALILVDYGRGALGARPLNEVIHRTGWWAIVFLIASLAVTPLRHAGRFGKLIDVRRMIGVGCFAYAALHLGLYVADQGFNLVKVVTEIVSRLYLTIGFVALLGLVVLAATSNDTMVKRLGGLNWRRLHQMTFGIVILALVHYFQQTKADISVPTLYAGLGIWLICYRVLTALRGEGGLPPVWLAGLAVLASALTFLGEAVGIALAFGRPILPFAAQFLESIFDTDLGIRPGWWVLAGGLGVVLLDIVRGFAERAAEPSARQPSTPQRRPAPASAG